jgi:SAM-dependent methyltransferase
MTVVSAALRKMLDQSSADRRDYVTAFEPELVPPRQLMETEGITTLEEWFRWAEEWVMTLKFYGEMTKSSRVLEVGCGLGRVAYPLRHQLLTGSYDGFDICAFKIDFLQSTFSPRYPNFRFAHADIHNTQSLLSKTNTRIATHVASRGFASPVPKVSG